MNMFLVKCALAIVGTIATVLVTRLRRPLPWSVNWTLLGAWAIRVGLLIVLHGVLHVRQSTDAAAFYEHVERVRAGEIPNREFSTPYGLFFTYAIAAPTYVVHSPLSMLILFQTAEFVGIYLLARSVAPALGKWLTHRLVLFYVVNPLILVTLWISGQDEALQVFAVGALCAAVASGGWLLAPMLAAFLMHMTKLYTAWAVVPFMALRRYREWPVFAIAFALPVAGAIALGSRVISTDFTKNAAPPDTLSELVTSGNMWFLLHGVWPSVAVSKLPSLVTLAGLAIAGIYMLFKRGTMQPLAFFLWGTSLFSLVFLVGFKMTHSMYAAVIVAPLLALALLRGGRSVALVLTWSAIQANDTNLFYGFYATHTGQAAQAFIYAYTTLVVVANLSMLVWIIGYPGAQESWPQHAADDDAARATTGSIMPTAVA